MVDVYSEGDRLVGKRVDLGNGRSAFIPGAFGMDAAGNPTSGGTGGGGGATTIADGSDIAEGATTATAYSDTTGAGAGTVVGLLKGQYVRSAPLGLTTDAAASSDTGGFTLIALFKRSLGYLATLSGAIVGNYLRVQSTTLTPTAGQNLSGAATTTSGGSNLPANPNRRPGDVQGQNVSAVTIGFNEFGGTAVIGAAGTYTVPAGATFSITTNQLINFIAASGTAAITITSL